MWLRTSIRPYESNDCIDLFKISTDEIFTWLPYGPFKDETEMRIFYENLSTKCELFTVFDEHSKIIHGIFALKNISDEHKKCEIGHIWYGEKYQRTHINTETMFLALSDCFDKKNFRRVSWKCDNLNLNSKRCALRLGFRQEGIFFNDQIIKGKNKDTVWFAILDKDWPHVKQHLIHLISTSKNKL